jgi:hypothetical protein
LSCAFSLPCELSLALSREEAPLLLPVKISFVPEAVLVPGSQLSPSGSHAAVLFLPSQVTFVLLSLLFLLLEYENLRIEGKEGRHECVAGPGHKQGDVKKTPKASLYLLPRSFLFSLNK